MRNIWARWVRSIITRGSVRQHAKGKRRPRLEHLEERLAPATFVWSGAGDGTNWANGPNWQAGNAPGANDPDVNLVFPNANVPHNTFNNIPGSAAIKSIVIAGQVVGIGRVGRVRTAFGDLDPSWRSIRAGHGNDLPRGRL